MNLKKCVELMHKRECPSDCQFRERTDRQMVLIPTPSETKGMIISRDPTKRWAHFYEYVVLSDSEPEERRRMLSTAIPLGLALRVIEFMKGDVREETKKTLFDTVFNRTYWTHLHKCPTDVDMGFRHETAEKCADKWLEKELMAAIGDKIRFIVALGNDVKRWVEKHHGEIEVVSLPHPSPQNNPIWCRSPKIEGQKINKLEREIERLLKLME